MADQWKNRFTRAEFKGTPNNAMFKGVPFIIISAEGDFGRRTVEHEFPQRDLPYSEDLGRRARQFVIDGQVIGADYLTQRDNLLTVCEDSGPGELIHPYYGDLNVICKKFTPRDSRRELRTATFQLVFVETGDLVFPIGQIDTETNVLSKATSTLDNLKAPFVAIYNAVRKAQAFNNGKIQMLDKALDAIGKAKEIADAPADFERDLQRAKARIDTLILSGGDLFDSLFDLVTFGLLDDVTLDAAESFQGFNGMIDFSPTVKPVSDDTQAIQDLTQSLVSVTMGLLLSRIDFDSRNQAEEFRDIVLNKYDELREAGALDDEVNQNMKDLRAAIEQDFDERLFTLASLTTFTPIQTVPALVVSHQLYGSIEQESDLIARNKIPHPGFVPGGVPIEVLIDAG